VNAAVVSAPRQGSFSTTVHGGHSAAPDRRALPDRKDRTSIMKQNSTMHHLEKFPRMVVGVVVVIAMLLLGSPVAQAANSAVDGAANAQSVKLLAPGEFHEIRNNFHTPAMCLQPREQVFGSPIVQMPCNGSSAQGWLRLAMGNNHYRFANTLGLCIFTDDNPANGTPIWLDECAVDGGTTVSNAEWRSTRSLPNPDVRLSTHVHFTEHNFCVDEPGASGASNVAVQLFACNTSIAQRWSVGFN
jgi:hypothetical protein